MRYAMFASSLAGCLFAVGLAGCAHSNTNTGEVQAASEGPVRAAEEAGAGRVPSAALYLKLAHEQIDDAKKLAHDGDKRASLIFARARVDAELALALAQEKSLQDEAQRLRDEGAAHEKL